MKSILTTSPDEWTRTSFRDYLRHELGRRSSANPRYSLRSFALQLEIDHSTLSQLIRGKRSLTERMIDKLGNRLRLDRGAIQAFVSCENRLATRPPTARRRDRQLSRDAVSLVSDLHHFAILELVRLNQFKPDSRWIGGVLGMSVDDVNLALTRLLRSGLLEMIDRGYWKGNTSQTTVSVEDLAYVAANRMMKQVRRLSAQAANDVSQQGNRPRKEQ